MITINNKKILTYTFGTHAVIDIVTHCRQIKIFRYCQYNSICKISRYCVYVFFILFLQWTPAINACAGTPRPIKEIIQFMSICHCKYELIFISTEKLLIFFLFSFLFFFYLHLKKNIIYSTFKKLCTLHLVQICFHTFFVNTSKSKNVMKKNSILYNILKPKTVQNQ